MGKEPRNSANTDDPSRESPNTVSLDTVIIFSHRMEALGEFYREAFKLGSFDRSPGHIGQQVGPVYLGIDQVNEPPQGGGVSLWFTVNDIESCYQRLLDLGATIRYSPTLKPWGGYLASVFDPDGNIIGLSERRD